MFNLELAFSDWRRQMAGSGIKTSEVLDELECHLRDEVESQIRAGVPAQAAFPAAVQRLGHGSVLNTEFEKLGRERSRLRRRRLALVGVGFGFGLTALGGLWFWVTLKVALAVAGLVPGSAGVGQRDLTLSLPIFCTGVALLLASGLSFVIAGGRRTKSRTARTVAT